MLTEFFDYFYHIRAQHGHCTFKTALESSSLKEFLSVFMRPGNGHRSWKDIGFVDENVYILCFG